MRVCALLCESKSMNGEVLKRESPRATLVLPGQVCSTWNFAFDEYMWEDFWDQVLDALIGGGFAGA